MIEYGTKEETKMNEIVAWLEVIAAAFIVLYTVADFIVSKYDSKIRARIELLIAIILAFYFLSLLYATIKGEIQVDWLSYATITILPFFLLAVGREYPRTLKEATIIIRKKIRQVVNR